MQIQHHYVHKTLDNQTRVADIHIYHSLFRPLDWVEDVQMCICDNKSASLPMSSVVVLDHKMGEKDPTISYGGPQSHTTHSFSTKFIQNKNERNIRQGTEQAFGEELRNSRMGPTRLECTEVPNHWR